METSLNRFIYLIQRCFKFRFLRKTILNDMYGSGSVEYNLERNNAPFSQRSNSEAYVVWNPAARCHADVTSHFCTTD